MTLDRPDVAELKRAWWALLAEHAAVLTERDRDRIGGPVAEAFKRLADADPAYRFSLRLASLYASGLRADKAESRRRAGLALHARLRTLDAELQKVLPTAPLE